MLARASGWSHCKSPEGWPEPWERVKLEGERSASAAFRGRPASELVKEVP